MNRRDLLAIAGVALVPAAAATAAEGTHHVAYSREAYEQALASGEAFMLDFYAGW